MYILIDSFLCYSDVVRCLYIHVNAKLQVGEAEMAAKSIMHMC